MRKSIAIAAAAVLFTPFAAVAAEQCMAVSEYAFQITPKQVIAISDAAEPGTVILSDGKLFVRNQWVSLSAEDAKRIRELETQLRRLEPRIQAENAELAQQQMQVFKGMGEMDLGDWERQQARDRKDRRFRIGPLGALQAGNGDTMMSKASDQLLGVLSSVMGDMRGLASGKDKGAEDRINKVLERIPMPSVGAGMQSKLCPEYAALNEIDNAVTYRYNGQPLELLRNMVPSMR